MRPSGGLGIVAACWLAGGLLGCAADGGLASARRIATRIAWAQQASPLIHLEIGDAEPTGGPEDWDGQLVPFKMSFIYNCD